MQEIKGGSKKWRQQSIGRKTSSAEDTGEHSKVLKITVAKTPLVQAIVPASVWRVSPFVFKPQTFMPESDRLKSRFIEPEIQRSGLTEFLEDPTTNMVYGVAGAPDDLKAKYFAAYLVQQHIKALGTKAHVVWSTLYSFGDRTLRDSFTDKSRPSLLVVSNLTVNSTHKRLEDARDLVERFDSIPRIVVCAGEDPLSFLAVRLCLPVNAAAYFCNSIVKQKTEVI